MADYRQEQPDMEPQEQQEPRPNRLLVFLRRLGTLLLTLIIVLGLVAVTLLGEGGHLDRLRRWLNYGSATTTNQYQFAADEHNQFGQIGDYLVMLSQNDLQILAADGSAHSAHQIVMGQPALDVGETMAVAYDVGGQSLLLTSVEGIRMDLPLQGEYRYISARLNGADWLAVTAEKSGYKGSVSVYNAEQVLVYEVSISSQFIIDAAVTEDCSAVLITALGQENGAFCTRLIRYDLTGSEPVSTDLLTNHLTFDQSWVGTSCASVSDENIMFSTGNGSVVGAYAYNGLYLHDYTLGDQFAALLLNRYQSGSIGTLVTLDDQGSVLATMDVSDEILDIHSAGEYLAVLSSNALSLYTRDLQLYSRLENTDYANRVIAGADGSALIIGNSSAWRYLP